jgi:hypothetical protein
MYSQLRSILEGRPFRQQYVDGPCRGDKGPTSRGHSLYNSTAYWTSRAIWTSSHYTSLSKGHILQEYYVTSYNTTRFKMQANRLPQTTPVTLSERVFISQPMNDPELQNIAGWPNSMNIGVTCDNFQKEQQTYKELAQVSGCRLSDRRIFILNPSKPTGYYMYHLL